MTTGPDTSPGPQPATAAPVPPQSWVPGPPLPETRAPRSRRKGLRLVVPVVLAVGAGVVRFSGLWGGAADPEVGDCVHTSGSSGTSFEVVDCSARDADHRVVGVDPRSMTSEDFETGADLCSSVPETTVVLWSGADTAQGTVYCAAPVGSAG